MLRDVSVREVMNGEYVGVSESDDLREAIELLLSEQADVAIVLRGVESVGVLTKTDALEALLEDDSRDTPAANGTNDSQPSEVATAMTTTVPTIQPDRGLHEARDRMTTAGHEWLVVTEGDGPMGVVTEHDLLAGSTIGKEPSPEDDRRAEAGVLTANATATGADTDSASEDAFEDQGICEVCGALTADLVAFNGQLRCADCRDV